VEAAVTGPLSLGGLQADQLEARTGATDGATNLVLADDGAEIELIVDPGTETASADRLEQVAAQLLAHAHTLRQGGQR
jgi:hypothetical protein